MTEKGWEREIFERIERMNEKGRTKRILRDSAKSDSLAMLNAIKLLQLCDSSIFGMIS